MGKGKLAKFAEMARMECVYEFPYTHGEAMSCPLRGRWHEDVFHNSNPIVLELGCGRGEYTVGLARLNPDINYIGVDIKGARMWTGARQAEAEGLRNVAFLRTNIEIIDHFFAPGEVAEIWLTFSDPQMKKVTKRLTGTAFIQRYRQFLADGGLVHLKTDSNFLFTYTEEMLRANGIKPIISTRQLYAEPMENIDSSKNSENPEEHRKHGDPGNTVNSLLQKARSIQTYYEGMWRSRGIDIKYLVFALRPTPSPLIEPEVEIPLDEYRSYNRDKRSEKETHI